MALMLSRHGALLGPSRVLRVAPRVRTVGAVVTAARSGGAYKGEAVSRVEPPPKAVAADEPSSLASLTSLLDGSSEDEDGLGEGEEVIQVDAKEVDEALKVENLGLSSETVSALAKRGIASLFPIQLAVFKPAQEGRDLIGRAKTGSGKTLAFALPVVEALLQENKASGAARARAGRPPRCLVLAPTRELANQVAREFESVCPNLRVASVYGGVSIGGQCRELERGVDVVVGTPGRVIDLVERGSLMLDKVRYAILDEADQMLDMGFEEDMETILGSVPKERQTLLFSATLPKWVHKIARRFQRSPLVVDLVGEENTGRLAETIRLMIMQVEANEKLNALVDVITLYGSSGKTIVFTNTKARAGQVADAVGRAMPCGVLHGDIPQQQRDKALQMFREGRYPVLTATDVAARGLDIPSVDLVVHFDVPQDNEAFLHRSGRTGRAGNSGTAIVLFSEGEARSLGYTLRDTKVEATELIGAPAPEEVLRTSAKGCLMTLDKVDSQVVEFFVPAAEKLLASGQPSRVLAAALASMSGFVKVPQPRSMLTYEEGYVTLRLMAQPGVIDGFKSLATALQKVQKRAKLIRDLDYAIGKIKLLQDEASGLEGAAFDVQLEEAQELLGAAEAAAALGMTLDKPRQIKIAVQGLLVGAGRRSGGPPRADGGSWGRWGEERGGRGGFSRDGRRGDRDRDRGGSWGRGSSSSGGGSGSSYGSNRDFREGRAASGGSYGSRSGNSSGSGYSNSGSSSRSSRSGESGRGQSSRDGGYASREGRTSRDDTSASFAQWSSSSNGRGSYSQSSDGAGSRPKANFTEDYFPDSGPAQPGKRATRGPKRGLFGSDSDGFGEPPADNGWVASGKN